VHRRLPHLALLCLLIAPPVLAQLDAQNLRRGLIAMEQQVHREPARALEELKSVEQAFATADGETQLWYLLRRAQAHSALFMYEAFQQDVARARGAMLSGANSELVLWLHTYAGIVEIRNGELRRGIEILADVAEQALNIDAKRLYVFAVQELAYTRGLLEQYNTSLQELQLAYQVALELNQPELIAMVNDSYGAVYGYMGDYPRSIEFSMKALEDYQRLGYREQTATAIQGLASTFRYSEQWQQAEKYYREYLEQTRYAPGEARLYHGNYGLALTFAEQGDCPRAVPQIELALSYDGPDDYDAELLKELAKCQARTGNLEAAEAAYRRAADILGSIPELDGTSWVLELDYVRSIIDFYSGETEQAFYRLDSYQRENLKQMEQRSSNRMNMLRAGLESERKDLEITLLERQAEVNRLQVETHQSANETQRYLIILAVTLCLMVLAGLLFQWRNNRRILALSHRDGLSGLYNRSYTFSYLEEVIPRIAVDSGGLSVILIDIDNFKAINDNYGHPVGDKVIREVANIGSQLLRSRDIMGRIGGEEFLCVLPRTTSEQCAQVAKRLLSAIAEHTFETAEGEEFSISISIGIADYDSNLKSAEQLYTRADRALYQSKATGKGRITTFSSDPAPAAAG
jgi:diguanylate cyclase (GGDEF)-like protein